MNKFKELLQSHHIQLAMAVGISIVVLAYFSKRILLEPIADLFLAIPPFIGVVFELLLGQYKESKLLKPSYWIAAIFLSTILVIIINWN